MPAASRIARRAQPGLLVSAAMVRALWLRAATAPCRWCRRASRLFTVVSWLGLSVEGVVYLLKVAGLSGAGAGLAADPQAAAEQLLRVIELGSSPPGSFSSVCRVGIDVNGQLGLRSGGDI